MSTTNTGTPARTPVFSNPDGVDAPEGVTQIGWTVQGAAPYVRGTNFAFPSADGTRTPASVAGWTAQSAGTGSDQNLVEG
jgi:hypothetical protein